MSVFERSFIVHAPLKEVWGFHNDPVALTKITPHPITVELQSVDYPVTTGSKVLMRMHIGPVSVQWNSQIVGQVDGEGFTDVQITGQGPFRIWKHTHSFAAVAEGTRVTDHVEYEMRFGFLGKLADVLAGRLMIAAMFSARKRATRAYLESGNRAGVKIEQS